MRPLKLCQKFPAPGREILIHPRHRAGLDVQIDGVAEDNQLDDRWQNQKHPHARVAQRLVKLFLYNLSDPSPHIFTK